MKILNLGLDNSVLNKDSNLAKRMIEYGELVEKYIVVVPAKKNTVIKLSDNVLAFGLEVKNKMIGLLEIYYLAKTLVKKERFNVITVQDQYYLGFVALKLARKYKAGLEIQVHGFEKYSGFRKIISKYILPRADSVRVVSQRLKKRMVDEFKVKEERINVIPVFVERATRNAQRVTRNDSKFVFLTIGRLVPVKNIKMQIEAMVEVVKRYPKAELWIVGEGPERGALKSQITNYKLQNNVKLLGWQDNVQKYYEQVDVFMLTSYAEGWPLVILEAANYSLPIIMTDTGSAGELIMNNESGIVIPVNDEEKLKEAMINLIKNSELREKLGQGAKEAVDSLPNKEQILRLYKESWERAMKI